MKNCVNSVVAGAFLALLPATHALAYEDPLSLYGDRISFEVLRNGKPVGEHDVTFSRDGASLKVHSDMSLKVHMLLLFTFSMHYVSDETWRDGALADISVDLTKGGKQTHIEGHRAAGKFAWTGPDGEEMATLPLIPTTHWNADILKTDRVLNTLTGKLNDIAVRRAGRETVETGTGPRQAEHYIYSGDLETESWYDKEGRWVKLRFKGSDGSTVEYRCRQCGSQVDP